jgi:predicted PurR-regulated permease PerM
MRYGVKGTLTSTVFIIVLLLLLSLFVLFPMLDMVILGAIVAYLIRPLFTRMEPHMKFRSLAVFIAMVLVLIPLIAVLVLFVTTLIQATPAVVNSLSSADMSGLSTSSIQNYPLVKQYLPEGSPYISSIINSFSAAAVDILKNVTEYLIKILESVPGIALALFIFFASTFYFARDGDKLWEYVVYIIPEDRKGYFNTLFEEIDRVLKSIFVGHFFTAVITGTIAGIGFAVLGYPFPLFLGVLTGFFQLIPIIGHWPTILVLALYDIFFGNYIRGIEVLILGVALSLIDMYIRPKLAGRYADIHPLIFLLGFLCGPLVMGVVGFIIGPLILGVTYAAVTAYKKDKTRKEEASVKQIK